MKAQSSLFRFSSGTLGLSGSHSRLWIVPALAALIGPMSLANGATIETYDDRDAFVQATGAESSTGPVPNAGLVINGSGTAQLGDVTFGLTQGSALYFGTSGIEHVYGADFTGLISGHDVAVTGLDGLSFGFPAPVWAAGFVFAEVTVQPAGAGQFIDSTYSVEGLNTDMEVVFSFQFNAPDDTLAFVGVVSDTPFVTLRTIEIVGGIENEFYGEVYSSEWPERCVTPSEAVTIVDTRLAVDGSVEFGLLDPNPPGVVTGYNVYRTFGASDPFELWELFAVGITDEDPVLPLIQWTNTSASISPTGIWFYQFTAVNDACPVQSSEGPL